MGDLYGSLSAHLGISRQYSISRERVRQIKARAFEKVREAVLAAARAGERASLAAFVAG